MSLFELVPLAAAAFAVPQFVPQLHRSLCSGGVEGVSWSWAALTSVGNAAWTVYFAWSGYWLALVPSVSASTMAAVLAFSIAISRMPSRRAVVFVASWAALFVVACATAGRVGLGTALSVAFVVQVAPAIWTAYRTHAPSGIAIGTWLLVLGELTCWGVYGLHQGDRRLVIMGATGFVAATLMILRAVTAAHTRRRQVDGPSGAVDSLTVVEAGW